MHLMGDHRLCDDPQSIIDREWAATWFGKVRRAGIAACERYDRNLYRFLNVRLVAGWRSRPPCWSWFRSAA
jgi:hypothetical protein